MRERSVSVHLQQKTFHVSVVCTQVLMSVNTAPNTGGTTQLEAHANRKTNLVTSPIVFIKNKGDVVSDWFPHDKLTQAVFGEGTGAYGHVRIKARQVECAKCTVPNCTNVVCKGLPICRAHLSLHKVRVQEDRYGNTRVYAHDPTKKDDVVIFQRQVRQLTSSQVVHDSGLFAALLASNNGSQIIYDKIGDTKPFASDEGISEATNDSDVYTYQRTSTVGQSTRRDHTFFRALVTLMRSAKYDEGANVIFLDPSKGGGFEPMKPIRNNEELVLDIDYVPKVKNEDMDPIDNRIIDSAIFDATPQQYALEPDMLAKVKKLQDLANESNFLWQVRLIHRRVKRSQMVEQYQPMETP